MNRAERKRQERLDEKGNASYTISRNNYEKLIQNHKANLEMTRQKTKEIVTESLLSAIIIVMKYELGFGKKRMQRFADNLNIQLNLIADKDIDHQDLVSLAEEIRDKMQLKI